MWDWLSDLFGGFTSGAQQGATNAAVGNATGTSSFGGMDMTGGSHDAILGNSLGNNGQRSIWSDILAASIGPTIMGTFGAVAGSQQGQREDEHWEQQMELERERLGLTREQMAQAMEIAKAQIKLKKKQLLLEAYANATQGALRGGESASASLSNAAQLQRVR